MSVAIADVRPALMGCLRELHLPTVRECVEEVSQRACTEGLSHERFLWELVDRECEARKQKRVERLLRESRLPLEKTLASFDQGRLPARVRHQVSALLDDSFLDRKENLLAFGNPGTGKSHLVAGIAQELIRRDARRIYAMPSSLLVQELLIAKRDLRLARVIKRLRGYDAIVIDDLGYVQQSREEMEVLFTLLAECYERSTIMITSNLPFSKWEQIFKDAMTTAAAIDRLVHHSIILELNIRSYREEEAMKRKEATGTKRKTDRSAAVESTLPPGGQENGTEGDPVTDNGSRREK